MRVEKYILENGFRTLGLVIVLAYGLCQICSKFKMLGICPMNHDSLTVGLLLILVGNSKHCKAQTPDQTIRSGLVFLCMISGVLLVEMLKPFLPIAGIVLYPRLTAALSGLVLGLAINRMRPSYADSNGIWRVVLHFVLTQMDFEKAFQREKMSAQPGDNPNPHSPTAQGDEGR